MDRNIRQKLRELYRDRAEKVAVFLRTSKTKSANYDKYNDTGYTVSQDNPVWIKAITHTHTVDGLIYKGLGLEEVGAKTIIIKKSDLSLIEICEKVEIDGKEYYAWKDTVGDKIQVYETEFDFVRVIIFRKNK
jgi:ribosomal protein S17